MGTDTNDNNGINQPQSKGRKREADSQKRIMDTIDEISSRVSRGNASISANWIIVSTQIAEFIQYRIVTDNE